MEGCGAQGCEALIPGMKALIDRSAESGVESICIGMPHRGVCPCSLHGMPFNWAHRI